MKNRKQETAGNAGAVYSFDYSLLLIVLCLLGFGLLMIYSSSSYTAQVKFQDSAYFLKKQLINVIVGIVVMIIVSKFDYRILLKRLPGLRVHLVTVLYFCAVLLQLSVYFVGREFNGAKRWLYLGPVSIQPAEISKIAVLLITASFINNAPAMVSHIKGALRILLAAAVLIVLVGKENLSSAIVMMGIVFIMCFVAARYKRLYFLTLVIGVGLVGLFIFFGDAFRMQRIQIWLDVENNKGIKAFDFIKDVPTDWDKTYVVDAKIGDYSVFARKDRNSSDWYVGCITDENARELDIPLSFLETEVKYIAQIYADSDDAEWKTNPTSFKYEEKTVTASDTLHVKLATSGGCAIRFIKQ